jgi:hypothetical protein
VTKLICLAAALLTITPLAFATLAQAARIVG